MDDTRKDRLCGCIIGSVVGDTFGSLAVKNLLNGIDEKILSPVAGDGVWSDASKLLLFYVDYHERFDKACLAFFEQNTTLFLEEANEEDCLPKSLYCVGMTALVYPSQFDMCLELAAVHDTLFHKGEACKKCTLLAKLWVSVIDGAYHGLSKRVITSIGAYTNLHNISSLSEQFGNLEESTELDQSVIAQSASCTDLVFAVLHTFKHTPRLIDGMRQLANYSEKPNVACILYGQLAGAYYGLTDIPESWLAPLKNKKDIFSTVKKLLPE